MPLSGPVVLRLALAVLCLALCVLSEADTEVEGDPNCTTIIVRKSLQTEHAIFGKVIAVDIDQEKLNKQNIYYYTKITVEVQCIYRGGVIPKDITVIGASFKKDVENCWNTKVEVDTVRIFYLNSTPDRSVYIAPYPTDLADVGMMDELWGSCDFDDHPTYPEGFTNVTAGWTCASAPPDPQYDEVPCRNGLEYEDEGMGDIDVTTKAEETKETTATSTTAKTENVKPKEVPYAVEDENNAATKSTIKLATLASLLLVWLL